MNLIFVTNARFSKTENGNIYGYHTSINYKTFEHYLKIFDTIKIIARVEEVQNRAFEEAIRVNLENVEVLPIPYFIGPKQYLRKFFKIKSTIRKYLNNDDALICRIPGTLGRLAIDEAKKINKPFGVEVAGDPYDVFAAGSFTHPLRIFFRYHGSKQLKKGVKAASAALYVTAKQLQKRYPVKKGVFQTNASNVILSNTAFVESPKKWTKKDTYTLISLGTLDQMYKAPDILIHALAKINCTEGLKFKLQWLGEGKYKTDMKKLATTLNIVDYVNFPGIIKPAEKVHTYLDNADLFILPSRTEGLPRAIVEAMARGLPCIGTKIGGIPELLTENALVPINDFELLSKKIKEVVLNETLYNKLAKENLDKAQEYAYDKLNSRRFAFYEKVKENTLKFNNKP